MIKKWVKEMKEKKKEQKILQKAEVHAAVSIAGLAAALAAVAEENPKSLSLNTKRAHLGKLLWLQLQPSWHLNVP